MYGVQLTDSVLREGVLHGVKYGWHRLSMLEFIGGEDSRDTCDAIIYAAQQRLRGTGFNQREGISGLSVTVNSL